MSVAFLTTIGIVDTDVFFNSSLPKVDLFVKN